MRTNYWLIVATLTVCVGLQVEASFILFDEEQKSQLIPEKCDSWLMGNSAEYLLKTEDGYKPCDDACSAQQMFYKLGSQSVAAARDMVWCCCERDRSLLELIMDRRIASNPPGYDSSTSFFGVEAKYEEPFEDYNPKKMD